MFYFAHGAEKHAEIPKEDSGVMLLVVIVLLTAVVLSISRYLHTRPKTK